MENNRRLASALTIYEKFRIENDIENLEKKVENLTERLANMEKLSSCSDCSCGKKSRETRSEGNSPREDDGVKSDPADSPADSPANNPADSPVTSPAITPANNPVDVIEDWIDITQ